MKTLLLFLISSYLLYAQGNQTEEEKQKEKPIVTYGSTFKLMNIHSKNRLHSHNVPYGI